MPEDFAGKFIDRFQILSLLGQGGMATVYKALDTRLDREVALKLIRRSAFPPEILDRILARFEREAKSLARLSHHNIVKVFDYGEYEGAPYLVLEYLSGGDLNAHLQGKQLAWQEAFRLILPIARALEFSHKQGIIHRDIKPSNIIFTISGEPMLSDFGIAKILEYDDAATLTGTGIGIGTPGYMAPEQWTGNTSPQSDLYGLGIVLYEMIAGRKPYTADTPAGVLVKQTTEPLPPVRKFRSDLPESVDQVILKALDKNPAARYADMTAFIKALEDQLATPVPQLQPELHKTVDALPVFETQTDVLPLTTPNIEAAKPAPVKKEHHDRAGWLKFIPIGGGILIVIALSFWGISGMVGTIPTPEVSPTNTLNATATATITITATKPPLPSATPTIEPSQTATTTPTLDMVSVLAEKLSRFTPIAELESEAFVRDISWRKDGTIIGISTTVGTYIVDATTLDIIKLIPATTRNGYLSNDHVAVAFSPTEDLVAIVTEGSINILDLESFKEIRNFSDYGGDSYTFASLDFSPDGETLFSAKHDTIFLIQVSNGNLISEYVGPATLSEVAISPDGKLLAAAYVDGQIYEWDVQSEKLINNFSIGDTTNGLAYTGVDFTPDGKFIVGASNNGIFAWDAVNGSIQFKIEEYYYYKNVSLYPIDSILVAHDKENVTVWDIQSGQIIGIFENISIKTWYKFLFSPDGSYLFDGEVLWGIKE